MSSVSCEARVNPDILRWARESLAIEVEKAAKAADVSPERYRQWELGEKYPSIAMLRELANLYKRPLAVFFMSEVPEDPPAPTDFRFIHPDERAHLSTESRLAIRKAQWRQRVAKELMEEIRYSNEFLAASITLKEPVAQAAARIRRLPFGTQSSWVDNREALLAWRQYLEDRGFFVFQDSMPIREVRGFSLLREGYPPVIVINSKDTVNGRIFTLFHEYGHCLLNRGGICNPGEVEFRDEKTSEIERYCNDFAGSFLVPTDELQPLINESHNPDVFELIHSLSGKFRVSNFVILRRLYALEFVSYKRYQRIYETLLAHVKEARSSGGDYYRTKFAELGRKFIALVVTAESIGAIPVSRALEFLDTKLKTVREKHRALHVDTPYDKIVAMLHGQGS